MIITPVIFDDTWTCLIRRGMLFSETESIEYFNLYESEVLNFSDTHGVDEILLVLGGEVLHAGISQKSGTAIFVPDGTKGSIFAVQNSIILSIRGYSARVADCLPSRIPEIPESERAI